MPGPRRRARTLPGASRQKDEGKGGGREILSQGGQPKQASDTQQGMRAIIWAIREPLGISEQAFKSNGLKC